MWEVGGSPRFASSRNIFYEDCDGVIFVWDVSVEATYHSLNLWLDELIKVENKVAMAGVGNINLPLLIVGSKLDKLSLSDRKDLQSSCPQHVLMVSIQYK